MDSDQFVELIKHLAVDGAVSSTLKNLTLPPGTTPPDNVLRVSHWFNKLPADDKKMVEAVARLSAGHSATTCLCILDGAQAIESGPDKGHLELFYRKGNQEVLLNNRSAEPLNDKLRLIF